MILTQFSLFIFRLGLTVGRAAAGIVVIIGVFNPCTSINRGHC